MLLLALCASLMAVSDGRTLVTTHSRSVLWFDAARGVVTGRIALSAEPNGIAVHGPEIYVAAGDSVYSILGGRLGGSVRSGWGVRSPVRNPLTGELYVLNRFDGTVSFIDPVRKTISAVVQAGREPYASALTPDAAQLWVACLLPEQPATAAVVAAKVSVIDAVRRKPITSILLPNGSTGVRGIAISPDGKYAFVTHILARYTVHTTQLEQGWINTNALTILDVRKRAVYRTVLLDDADAGAANPWAVAVRPDGKRLYVTHAGTDELSSIDLPAMLARLLQYEGDPANQLGLLQGIRSRIALPGKGARAIALAAGGVWVAEEFSGTLAKVREDARAEVGSFRLAERKITEERRGETLFHDATWCFQRWQSCASCHPDGRNDGLNWDLLNDGLGNPKNTKSLVYSHRTGAAMWTGVRPDADYAIRSGMNHILFAEPRDSDASAIAAYLQSLVPLTGKWGQAAERGKKLYFSKDVGCASCHPPPLYTDMEKHDVGTRSPIDVTNGPAGAPIAQQEFKTPSLLELWRTAPYMHDGRYATIEETITTGNHNGLRGKTSQLSREEIRDLAEFLRSLGSDGPASRP